MDASTLFAANPQDASEQNPRNFILTEVNTTGNKTVIPNSDIIVSYNAKKYIASYQVKTSSARSNSLLAATTYTATLSVAVKDKNALVLLEPITTNFITGTSVDSGVKPNQPSSITVSAKNGSATITWSEVIGTDISYKLYLSKDGGVTYKNVGTNIGTRLIKSVNTFNYTFSPMLSNVSHFFVITAVEANVESFFAIANGITLLASPSAPSNVTLSTTTTVNGVSSATITWNYVEGLQYRLSSIQGKALDVTGIIGPIIGTAPNQKIEYRHNNVTTGAVHQYQVIAENSQGSISAPTTSNVETAILPTPAPKNVSVIALIGTAIITWEILAGNGISYELNISTDSGASFTLAKSLITGPISNNSPNPSTISYSLPIDVGVSYLFSVVSVRNGIKSIATLSSNEVILSPIPAKPTGFMVTVSDTAAANSTANNYIANIKWDVLPNLTYNLLVSTDSGKSYTSIDNNAASPFNSSPLNPIKIYRYKLIAANAQGSTSPEVVSSNVVLLTVKATVGDARVDLSWTNPATTTAVTYNVYLSKDNKNTYQKITDI